MNRILCSLKALLSKAGICDDWSDEDDRRAIKSLPGHFVGLTYLTGTIQSVFRWVGQNQTSNSSLGGNYSPSANSNTLTKQYTLGTTLGNTTPGGGDEVFSLITSIAGSGSATIDLNAMTNVMGQTSIALARTKSHRLALLSSADDSTLSPAPNAASTVTVTNQGPQLPAALEGQTGGSGLTLALTTGATIITAVAIGVAGSGYPPSATFCALPQQAGGSGGVITVTTNASGVPTSVAVGQGGTGYANATVPSVVQFFQTLTTGNQKSTIDVTATGTLVSAVQRNVRIYNNDAANTVYFELDGFAATT